MRLWELHPVADWGPLRGRVISMRVRAATVDEARRIAAANAGEEGPEAWYGERSLCRDAGPAPDGAAGVIEREVYG